MPVIYKITSKTSKLSYIGQTHHTAKRRFAIHMTQARQGSESSPLLYDAIREYKQPDFEYEVLVECTLAQLDEKEIEMIALYETVQPGGYNIQHGGRSTKGMQWRKKCKDNASAARRRQFYKDYPMPRKMIVRCNSAGEQLGFRVSIIPELDKTFICSGQEMEDKYFEAMEYYRAITSGELAPPNDKHRWHYDEVNCLWIPKGIAYQTKKGGKTYKGFVVKAKKGKYSQETFVAYDNFEDNLREAIIHLEKVR